MRGERHARRLRSPFPVLSQYPIPIHSTTLGDKIFDDRTGAAALMHDITSHFWCRLAQADVFCAWNTDVFQMLSQRCDPNTARRQGHGARSYSDLMYNLSPAVNTRWSNGSTPVLKPRRSSWRHHRFAIPDFLSPRER
jgi:hypothetical protein